MQTEITVMPPQTKECLGLPEAGRGKERPSPGGLVESMVLPAS